MFNLPVCHPKVKLHSSKQKQKKKLYIYPQVSGKGRSLNPYHITRKLGNIRKNFHVLLLRLKIIFLMEITHKKKIEHFNHFIYILQKVSSVPNGEINHLKEQFDLWNFKLEDIEIIGSLNVRSDVIFLLK